ncbi:MAG: hypothetical protein ACO23R_14535 [bacterium]
MATGITLDDLAKIDAFKKEASKLLKKQAKRLVELDDLTTKIGELNQAMKVTTDEVNKLRENDKYKIFDGSLLEALVGEVTAELKNEQKAKAKAGPAKEVKRTTTADKWNLLKEFVEGQGGAEKVKLTQFKQFLEDKGFSAEPKQWLKPLGLHAGVIQRVDKASPAAGSWFHLSKLKFSK